MKITREILRKIIKEEIQLQIENSQQYKSIEEKLVDLNPNESIKFNIYTPTRGIKKATVTKIENIGFMKEAFGDFTYKVMSDDGSIETYVTNPQEFNDFFSRNRYEISY